MDLKFLIPSKVRRMVLEYFVTNPNVEVHVNELARRIKISPQQTYRELINMENWGFLFSSKLANQRMYRVNKKFAYYNELSELLEKEKSIQQIQPPKISKILDWKELASEYKKIPISAALDKSLKKGKQTPRAYTEEKMLKQKGLL